MAGTSVPFVKPQYFDANGAPLASGQLFAYEAGTSTKATTYSDAALTTANTNPIVLDAAGRASIFLDAISYKFVMAPSTDSDPPVAPLWTVDNVQAVPFLSAGLVVDGRGGINVTTNDVVYLSDGRGSRTAGRWYKGDADFDYASSDAPQIGLALNDVATDGATLSVQLAGLKTGLSGLIAGSKYYISATAGELTATAPTFARLVGVANASGTELVITDRPSTPRRVASWQSTIGNIGAGEDILASYSASADELSAQGMMYEVHFWGLTANNANAKTVRLRVIEGANNTVLLAPALTVSEAGFWSLEARLIRINTTQAKTHAKATTGPTAGGVTTQSVANVTATWANSVELRLTGEATSNDDITMQGGMVRLVPISY